MNWEVVVRKFLGLFVALLFLVGMVMLTGPEIWIRRVLNKIRGESQEKRRKTEVAWQLAWARRYLVMVEFVMGMKVNIDIPTLWWDGNYIVVLNHRNVLDHLIAARVFDEIGIEDPRWIVKEQMRKAPIVGASLARAEFAFVSRNGDPADLDRIRDMAKIARKDNVGVSIYPEGTRFDGKPKEGSRYTAVRDPKVGGFSTLCEELPGYKVLIICIDWGDLPDARTIWDGSAYVNRQVNVTVWEQENEGAENAPDLLERIWTKMDRKLTGQI